jgi:hypothetical protein
MPTPWRVLLVPVVAAVALVGCASATPETTASSASAAPGSTAPASVATTGDTEVAPSSTIAGAVQEIVVHVGVDDAATTGSRVEQVRRGQQVVLRLMSDGDEQYHVHGYDLEQKVAAGVEAQFEFTADMAGSFEVESHVTHKVYLVLEVG